MKLYINRKGELEGNGLETTLSATKLFYAAWDKLAGKVWVWAILQVLAQLAWASIAYFLDVNEPWLGIISWVLILLLLYLQIRSAKITGISACSAVKLRRWDVISFAATRMELLVYHIEESGGKETEIKLYPFFASRYDWVNWIRLRSIIWQVRIGIIQ